MILKGKNINILGTWKNYERYMYENHVYIWQLSATLALHDNYLYKTNFWDGYENDLRLYKRKS